MREEEERTIKERTVITGEISLERHEDSCTPENSNQGEVIVPENQGEQLPHEELRAPGQGELRVYQRRQRRQVSEVQQNQSEEQRSTENPVIPNAYVPGPTSSSSSPIPTPPSESGDHSVVFPRRSSRVTAGKPPAKFGSWDNDIANYISYASIPPAYKSFIASLHSVSIPKNWQVAKQDPRWLSAMQEELQALKKNNTWELVPLPAGKRAVGCKWVYTVKQTLEGKVDRYKARLVAKGYSQTYGIDYDETFTPVAKMSTVRTLVSCAANFNWPLHQLDVMNAFLHGDLHEEVYMEIPPGFGTPQMSGKVCKLKKSLYGLKQSPRAWFDRFRRAVCSMGYRQCNGDHTVFYRHSKTQITILAVYVDDIVITGDDVKEIQRLKNRLGKEFEVKDLGQLRYFLGIEIARSPRGIVLSQRKYVLDLLSETGMLGCKVASTPVEQNHKLSTEGGDFMDKKQYQRLVGQFLYLFNLKHITSKQ